MFLLLQSLQFRFIEKTLHSKHDILTCLRVSFSLMGYIRDSQAKSCTLLNEISRNSHSLAPFSPTFSKLSPTFLRLSPTKM